MLLCGDSVQQHIDCSTSMQHMSSIVSASHQSRCCHSPSLSHISKDNFRPEGLAHLSNKAWLDEISLPKRRTVSTFPPCICNRCSWNGPEGCLVKPLMFPWRLNCFSTRFNSGHFVLNQFNSGPEKVTCTHLWFRPFFAYFNVKSRWRDRAGLTEHVAFPNCSIRVAQCTHAHNGTLLMTIFELGGPI